MLSWRTGNRDVPWATNGSDSDIIGRIDISAWARFYSTYSTIPADRPCLSRSRGSKSDGDFSSCLCLSKGCVVAQANCFSFIYPTSIINAPIFSSLEDSGRFGRTSLPRPAEERQLPTHYRSQTRHHRVLRLRRHDGWCSKPQGSRIDLHTSTTTCCTAGIGAGNGAHSTVVTRIYV